VTPKKALTWVGIAFVVIFIVTQPGDSAGVLRLAFGGIESAADQLNTFVRSIL
jgi:hypothetical protein